MANSPFKDHFSDHAQQYAAARPSYPAELFAWLAGLVNQHNVAWDAATGNGQAARGLANHFDRIHASDASAQQIAAAELHRPIEFHCEPAEASSLPEQSVDLVAVAQAAHWLELDRFYREVERVLKPSGALAMWCYGINTINTEIDALFLECYHSLDEYWPAERRLVEAGYQTLPFPFAKIDPPSIELSCDWYGEDFLAYMRSWSAVQRSERDTGLDPLAQISKQLPTIWGSGKRQVRWPISMLAATF